MWGGEGAKGSEGGIIVSNFERMSGFERCLPVSQAARISWDNASREESWSIGEGNTADSGTGAVICSKQDLWR